MSGAVGGGKASLVLYYGRSLLGYKSFALQSPFCAAVMTTS